MDITPLIPEGQKIITGYGTEGFTISGEIYHNSVLVLPHHVMPWPVTHWNDEAFFCLEPLLESEPPEMLLIGCGEKHMPLTIPMRQALKKRGISVDSMGTGAACRTYNILLAEGRNVAAALVKLL